MENWRKIGASLVCVLVFGCYERTQWDLGTRLSVILCFEANFVMLYCDNMTNGKSQTMVDCLASTAVIGGEVSRDRMREFSRLWSKQTMQTFFVPTRHNV